MALAELVGYTAAASSLIFHARRIRDEIKKLLLPRGRPRKPSPIEFLDCVLYKMRDVVKDYYRMLSNLDNGLLSEAKTQKALQQFQKSREKLLWERRTMAIEVSHVLRHEKYSPLHSFCLAVQRVFDVSELRVGSLRRTGPRPDEAVAPSRGPKLTLGKFMLAELEPGARITAKRRLVLRRQIREVREFLELRRDEMLRNYFEARYEISGGELAVDRKQKLRDRFKPRGPRKKRGSGRRKSGLKGRSKG
jgi:hypothetical protein